MGIDLPRLSEAFPPDNAPKGRAPVGVKPFSWSTDSDSSLEKVKGTKLQNKSQSTNLFLEFSKKKCLIFGIFENRIFGHFSILSS